MYATLMCISAVLGGLLVVACIYARDSLIFFLFLVVRLFLAMYIVVPLLRAVVLGRPASWRDAYFSKAQLLEVTTFTVIAIGGTYFSVTALVPWLVFRVC
jgi:hypothetical protein